MTGSKKRLSNDESSFKRKKIKTTNTKSNLLDPVPVIDDADSEELTAELLSSETIREGMLLLGCVTEVKTTCIVMSLPGYLTGVVPAYNISNAFTKVLTNLGDDSYLLEPSVDLIMKVGMVFPCKVIQVSKDASKRKPSITLSINPQDVNAELKPSSLYSKMVLFVSVCSIEDHGYIVDVGTKYIQGFLPKKYSGDKNVVLKVGEVIPTYVKKIVHCDKFSAKIQLSKLDFSEDFPEVPNDDIKLSSLLPGARIQLDVIEVKHPFVYMKYMSFDACASTLYLGGNHKSIKVGTTIHATVLYIHPVTHIIYCMLSLKPSPDIYAEYFRLRKFESVKNLKYECFYKNHVYYKINKGTYGFIHIKDLPSKGSEASSRNNNVTKACVLSFHYMDNLVQMTAKPSMVEQKIILPEEVQIGDIFEAVVKKHVDGGMLVCVCPGLFGFVRRIHMSDVFVTKPELLHPVGSKVKCRVLSINEKGKLVLSCKESIIKLQERYILKSYDEAQEGQFYKGVVVKKADSYILIQFFNDVQGIVIANHIPEGSVFYVGQIVLCEVSQSIPSQKKLKLSLEIQGWCSIEEIDDFWDKSPCSNENVSTTKPNLLTYNGKDPESDSQTTESMGKRDSESVSHKSLEAVIKQVKSSQLNILVNKSRGRVHITELGCVSEGIYPLREYHPEQKLNVYVIGEYQMMKYLKITSRNKFIKECSLNLSSLSSSKDLKPGTSLIGFVKKVCNVSAVVWLSPSQTGILDYLHFSENLKVVKKVRRYLKVGLSIKVSILENEMHTENGKCISVTKIERRLPQVGENILGLVQIGCLERGLILKLPFGYHGVAAITDLTDVYSPVQSLLDKCQRLKFVQCHVLDVNHHTKYCQVSLRKSRVYSKAISNSLFCPEILPSIVKEGDCVKGFVKSVSKSALSIVFGRNLEGKVFLHRCSVTDCSACSTSNNILDKYPIGSVAEVVIDKIENGRKSFTLILTDFKSLENFCNNRLSIKDISWEENE